MAITISVTAGSGYAGSTYTQTGAAGAGNWYGDSSPISGATASTFVMDTENEGKKITFRTPSPDETSNSIELWIPSDLGVSLTHWYDAYADETLTLATADVTTWANRVAAGASLGQATTGNKPDYSATGRNSKPAITADGTDDFFTYSDAGASLPAGTNPSTVFTMSFFTNATGLNWRALSSWGAGGSGTSRLLAKSNPGEDVAHTGGSAGTDNISTIDWPNADKLVIDETISTASNLYIDGNTTPVTRTATYNSGTTSHAYLFRSPSGQYWHGGTQEYGVIAGTLTTNTRQLLEGYLAHKWGKTALLPGGHPYATNPPYVPTFAGSIAFGDMVVTGVMGQPAIFTGAAAFGDMVVTGVAAFSLDMAGAIAFEAMEVAGTMSQRLVITGAPAFGAMEVAGVAAFKRVFAGAAAFGDMIAAGTMSFSSEAGDMAGYAVFGEMIVAGTMTFQPPFVGSIAFGDMIVTGTLAIVHELDGSITFGEMIAEGVLDFAALQVDPIVWDEMIVTGVMGYVAPDVIVEDGTIVAGAESYISPEYARAFALARGVTLPDDISILKVHMIKAMDFIERQRDKYKGLTSSEWQWLAFPRRNVYIDGLLLEENVIPERLKMAQAQLTIYSFQGIELEPIAAGGETKFLIKQKLGPIEREYSEAAYMGSSKLPTFYTVNSLLSALMKTSGMLTVSRA